MKLNAIILTVMLASVYFSSKAQTSTDDEAEYLRQQILAYEGCFTQFSKELSVQSLNLGNGNVEAFVELTFEDARFAVSDVDELKDIRAYLSHDAGSGTFSIADYSSIGDVFNIREIDYLQANCYNRPETFHILGHGMLNQSNQSAGTIQIDGTEIAPKEMARMMTDLLMSYEGVIEAKGRPFTVVVHSCKAGESNDNSFAARLSLELSELSSQIYVVAAPGLIYPSLDTKTGYYNEKIANNKAEAQNETISGKKWNIFHNGKFICQGKESFDESVTQVQSLELR